ncbi:MAG: cupin domain-containing protein [Firmicutes bacterium]|nr:cupin domain-containing protein [Bacillota bacterium]
MAEHLNILENTSYSFESVKKVSNFQGGDITADTYYFKPSQILAYHRHPQGDQIFFVLKGSGRFHLDNGTERIIDVKPGSTVYVPAGTWHQLANGNEEMVASQVTKAGAGMESRS